MAYSALSHYLNQCWIIVNSTPRNKLQRNFNQNTKFFIENVTKTIVCETAAILSKGRWVNCVLTYQPPYICQEQFHGHHVAQTDGPHMVLCTYNYDGQPCYIIWISQTYLHIIYWTAYTENRPLYICTIQSLSVSLQWGHMSINPLGPIMTPYGDFEVGQHGSHNGLLADSTKPLPDPMSTYRQ